MVDVGVADGVEAVGEGVAAGAATASGADIDGDGSATGTGPVGVLDGFSTAEASSGSTAMVELPFGVGALEAEAGACSGAGTVGDSTV